MYTDIAIPKSGSIGNFPMFNGTLNGLSIVGSVYRKTMTAKFTMAKVITIANTEMFATSTMSPTNANAIEASIIPITAIQGVFGIMLASMAFAFVGDIVLVAN